jgi:hypothetical protein
MDGRLGIVHLLFYTVSVKQIASKVRQNDIFSL